jgi:aminobenzoyl-glutamate utilization protein B
MRFMTTSSTLRNALALGTFAFGLPLLVDAQPPDARARILQNIEAKREAYGDTATQIWKFAEVGYQESRSSALLQKELAAAGFAVKAGVSGMPTAFVASYGSGKPVIAFVGEFDALPGLSQDAVPERRAVTTGGPGHGCGHNLLGTASMAAAIAVKDWLASAGRPGTVRYYGTPAEEGGGAKGYMVRDGLFDDVDTAISWHPGDANDASSTINLAIVTGRFRFHGVAAHAAAAPDRGRSALDAVEAMNHMVDMMREHVPTDSRIHYVITKGGAAVNIVPDFAEVLYAARNPDMRVLDGIWQRIVDAAKGAALGTGTTMEVELESASYNVLPNTYLADLQRANMLAVGGVQYSPEERAFAETIRKTLEGRLPELGSEAQVQPISAAFTPASTDLGDVSWKVPTTEISTATWVPGVPAHSWQAVACDGMSIGLKGMIVAAKTMALTGFDLFSTPEHVGKARAEFDRRLGGATYSFKLGNKKPPLDYRK